MSRPFERALQRAHRPFAKVCGLKRPTDLDHALELGADLTGFVFHPPSPRHVSEAQIIALCGAVHDAGARTALVTVDAERAATDRLVELAGLDVVQLCGSEDPASWRETTYGLLRRIGVDAGKPESCFEEVHAWQGVADAFVLDHPASAGGSGVPVDLALAGELARLAPCFLAGGLDGDADAFRDGAAPGPFIGFDASSRLESQPGVKDRGAMERFIRAAHEYSYPSISGPSA